MVVLPVVVLAAVVVLRLGAVVRLRVWVGAGSAGAVVEVVGATPGSGVAETADADVVVDIVSATVDLLAVAGVVAAVDWVGDDETRPSCAASPLEEPTDPDRAARAVDASAASEDCVVPVRSKAPSAAAVDPPAVMTPTISTEVNATRERRMALHRCLIAPTGRNGRRLIDGRGSRRRDGIGGC